MADLFWNDAKLDPKRRYRYKFTVGGIAEYYVKTANMPKATVSTIEHSYLDYNFKFPGRVTWDPISVTLVAPAGAGVSDLLMSFLDKGGYKFPTNSAEAGRQSLGKASFQDAFGGKNPTIELMDQQGGTIERWTLMNAFLTSIDWGGSLDYTSDEMLELTLEISFDWASPAFKGGAAPFNRI